MSFTRKLCCIILLGLFSFAPLACDSPSRRASIDISSHKVFYKFEKVDRNDPEVYIYPTDGALYPPTALMLPFPLTQTVGPREAESMSKGLSRILWQAMVKEEAFSILEYAENIHIYSLNQALALARNKGADMLITGSIPYVIVGGSVGLNQLVVYFEIYDVQTGELIWSISTSGSLDFKPAQDFIFIERRSKLPPDSIFVVAMALGSDVGRILRDWAQGENEDLPGDKRAPDLDGGPISTPEEPPAF